MLVLHSFRFDRFIWLLCAIVALTACGSQAPAIDAGRDGHSDTADLPSDAVEAGTTGCATDDVCSDGTYCNGVERCSPSTAGADERGCIAASSGPCQSSQ